MIRNIRIYILFAVLAAIPVLLAIYPFNILVFQESIIVGKGPAILFNACTFALFCIVLCFGYVAGRFKLTKVLIKASLIAIWMVALDLSAYLIENRLEIPEIAVYCTQAVIVAVVLLVYFHSRKREGDKVSSTAIRKSAVGSGQIKYAYSVLYAVLTLYLIIAIALFVTSIVKGANISLPFCLLSAVLCCFLWRITGWRGVLLPAVAVAAIEFITCGIELSIINVVLVVSLSDLYCRKELNI